MSTTRVPAASSRARLACSPRVRRLSAARPSSRNILFARARSREASSCTPAAPCSPASLARRACSQVKEFKLNAERNNGRAAMMGIYGMMIHEGLTGNPIWPLSYPSA